MRFSFSNDFFRFRQRHNEITALMRQLNDHVPGKITHCRDTQVSDIDPHSDWLQFTHQLVRLGQLFETYRSLSRILINN